MGVELRAHWILQASTKFHCSSLEGHPCHLRGLWENCARSLCTHYLSTQSGLASASCHLVFCYLRASHLKNQNQTTIPTNISTITISFLCNSSEGTWSRVIQSSTIFSSHDVLVLVSPRAVFQLTKKCQKRIHEGLHQFKCLKLVPPITLGVAKFKFCQSI